MGEGLAALAKVGDSPPRVPLALVGAVAAGVLMSFGQTFAAEGVAPLFNSAAPVVALAAVVALATRTRWSHLAAGAVAGPLAMVGYYATSQLRGFPVSMRMVVFWSAAGVIAGAAAGLAVWLLRGNGSGAVRAVAGGYFPGIALGEAAHGLTRIADTTPVAYWWALAAVGVILLAWTAGRHLDVSRLRVIAAAATVAVAAGLWAVYGLI